MAIKIDKNSRTYNEVMANVLRREYEFQAQRERNRMEGMRDAAMYSAQESQYRERIAAFGSPRKWASTALNFAQGIVENTKKTVWTIPRGASYANQSRKMYDLATDASYRAYQTDDEEERKRLLRESEKYRLYAKTIMDSDAIQNLEDLGNLDLSTGEGRTRVAGIAAGTALEIGGFLPVGAGVKGAQATSKLQRAVALSLGLGDVADVAVDAARGSQFVKQAVVSGVAQAPIQGALDTLITPEEDSLTDNIMYSAGAGVALNLGFGFLGYTGNEAVRGITDLRKKPPVVDFTDTVKAENINIPDDIDNVLEARNTIDTLAMLQGNVVGGKAFNIDVNDPKYTRIRERMIDPLTETINAKKARENVSIDTLKGQRVRFTSQPGVELKGTVTDQGLQLDSGKVLPMDEKLEKALVKGFDVDEQIVEKPSSKTIPPVLKPIENIINNYKTKEDFVRDYRKVVRAGGLKSDETGELFIQQFEVPDDELTKTQKELRQFVIDLSPEKQQAVNDLGVESPEEIYDLVKGSNVFGVATEAKFQFAGERASSFEKKREEGRIWKRAEDGSEMFEIRDDVVPSTNVNVKNETTLSKTVQDNRELVSINGKKVYLDGKAKDTYFELKEEYQKSLDMIEDSYKRFGNSDLRNAKKKAEGMKFSAKVRELTGQLTEKEKLNLRKRLESNYVGKEVVVNGREGVISDTPSFGKYPVSFPDGTKANYTKAEIVPKVSVEEKMSKMLSPEGVEVEGLNTEAKFQVEEGDIKQLQLEARKYKSPEEFVKAQGTPVYHGSSSEITEFEIRNPKRELDPGDYGRGVYFTPNKKIANSYGDKITEAFVDLANPYTADLSTRSAMIKSKNDLIDIINANSDLNLKKDYQGSGKILSEFIIEDVGSNEFSEIMQKAGYDGFIAKGNQPETVVFDPKKIKTKQQLTDIWKEANQRFQTSEPSLKQQAAKVNSVKEGGQRSQELSDEDIAAILDEAANVDNQGMELGELEIEVRKIMQQLEAEGFNLTPEQVSSTPNLNKLDEAIDQGVTPDPDVTEQAHQEYIKNTGPRDEVDKTAGPQKESRFFKRVGEQRDLEGEPLMYTPAVEKEADGYANNLVETDLESARQITMNQKSTGDAYYDIKIAQAYADKMAELGNMDEFTDAVRSISSISTQRGKGIAALRNTRLLDPTTEVRKVVKNKKARVAKQVEQEIPKAKKGLTDIQVNKDMLSKILDDLTCK